MNLAAILKRASDRQLARFLRAATRSEALSDQFPDLCATVEESARRLEAQPRDWAMFERRRLAQQRRRHNVLARLAKIPEAVTDDQHD